MLAIDLHFLLVGSHVSSLPVIGGIPEDANEMICGEASVFIFREPENDV